MVPISYVLGRPFQPSMFASKARAYPIGVPEYLLKIVVKSFITLRPGAFTKKIIEKFKK